MKSINTLRIAIGLILVVALVSLTFKLIPISKHIDDFYAEEMYQVNYSYFLKTEDGNTKVNTYLPKNNDRQRIRNEKNEASIFWAFDKSAQGNNLKANWITTKEDAYENLNYSFTFEGKTKNYTVPSTFNTVAEKYNEDLKATENIQVNDAKIEVLANDLIKNAKTDREAIQAIFDYVQAIPSAPIQTLSDAISTLERNRASCNGKSRLLTALARNLGYPTKIKGGIILEKANKRTSHSWTEISINDKWVPFDALNGHFAYLPANYMELYSGDEFLITHTKGIDFDYSYEIEKQNKVPFLKMNSSDFSKISPISLWGLVENKVLSMKSLLLLLMLPIGGLLVAFLRNMVGLRTFGVFLPVLIAFSLLETGFTTGILLFLFLILFVGLVARPFNNMGLLHTPKLVVSLTLMVLAMLIGSYIGVAANIGWLSALTFFPTIILTVSAEKFSNLIIEDGFTKAAGTLFQTLLAVGFCYFMLSTPWLPSILILFPEVLLIVIVLAMLLGKYIGLRWTELLRFKPMLNFKLA